MCLLLKWLATVQKQEVREAEEGAALISAVAGDAGWLSGLGGGELLQ